MKIGNDILSFNEFPKYSNRHEIRFFYDNFTENEMNFALSKKNPDTEFARMFSIKESLVKADNKLININFNKIQLSINDGKISYNNFRISSSITDAHCVSVVMSI